MEESNKNLKGHVFVCTSCTYKKNDLTDSDPEEARILRKNLKNRVYEKYGKNAVKVSSAQCLGECANGIAAVFYPKGEWLTELRPSDEDKVFEKIENLIN
jgi:predicted metal-binding protein